MRSSKKSVKRIAEVRWREREVKDCESENKYIITKEEEEEKEKKTRRRFCVFLGDEFF